jgi:hypothetical protein
MFGYIASFLGFQGQNTENSSTDVESGPNHVSCEGYGYSLPDPAVRLRLSSTNDSVVRIFGHPPQEDYPEAMHYPGSTIQPRSSMCQICDGRQLAPSADKRSPVTTQIPRWRRRSPASILRQQR